MALSFYAAYNNLTKNYYGLSLSSATDQEKIAELNSEFYARLTADQISCMEIVTGTKESTVLTALQSFAEKVISAKEDLYQPYAAEITALLNGIASTVSQWSDDTRLQLGSIDLYTVANALRNAGTSFLPSDPNALAVCNLFLNDIGNEISAQSPAIKASYLLFFTEKLQDISVYTSEATVALSPTEVEQRRIVFEIFSLALSMLSALQKASTLAGTLMSYYTSVQREYMDLISQIQLYGPTGKYKILANSLDFGKTELGYANTTVRNVLEYLIQQIQTTDEVNGQKTVEWYSMTKEADTALSAPISFSLVEKTASNGEKGYVFSMIDRSPLAQDPPLAATTVFSTEFCTNVNGTLSYSADTGIGTGTTSSLYVDNLYLMNDSLGVVQQQQDLATRLLEHMTKEWNQTSDAYVTFGTNTLSALKTLWSESGTTGTGYGTAFATYLYGPTSNAWVKEGVTDQKKIDAAASFRSEVNAQIQIYLQSAQSLKQLAEDTGKRAESVLSQIQQSQENQISLLSSIIDSLKGLLTAVFR